jgi:hypothetical protein
MSAEEDICDGLIRAEFACFAKHEPDAKLKAARRKCESKRVPTTRPTILIADDCKPFRDLIATLVRDDFEVVAEVEWPR